MKTKFIQSPNTDLSVSHYTQYNSISQNVQSKKVMQDFYIFLAYLLLQYFLVRIFAN